MPLAFADMKKSQLYWWMNPTEWRERRVTFSGWLAKSNARENYGNYTLPLRAENPCKTALSLYHKWEFWTEGGGGSVTLRNRATVWKQKINKPGKHKTLKRIQKKKWIKKVFWIEKRPTFCCCACRVNSL